MYRQSRKTRILSNVVRTALTTKVTGQSNSGTLMAWLGAVLAVGSLFLIPAIGVAALCLVLVLMLGFGGMGAWMQLDRARGAHPDEAVDGVRSVLRILVVFALVTPFWSLFDQKASTWVLQADLMTKPSWFQSSQMQALNPMLVMLLIPFNNLILYPMLKRMGVELTALRRMGLGIAFSGWHGSSSALCNWRLTAAIRLISHGKSCRMLC
jgi:POT family proton-dependent oligopeptide transporter